MEIRKQSGVVRLSEEGQTVLVQMLQDLNLTNDGNLKINASKLLSFIVNEFYERSFEKCKSKIIETHRDKRKDASEKLVSLSETELETVLKFLEKVKKDGVQQPK